MHLSSRYTPREVKEFTRSMFLGECPVNELIKAVVACIEKVVDKAEILTPLLQVIAVIIGLCVIGVMVLRGGR